MGFLERSETQKFYKKLVDLIIGKYVMKNIIYILKLFLSRVTIGIYIVAVSSANLMSSPALAETSEIDIAHINSLFQQAAIDSGAVGVQLSIIKGGQQFDFVHGSANTELNLPMTQDTVIQIGSTTKVFNAAIVMSMVEEDLLDLDVPVKH